MQLLESKFLGLKPFKGSKLMQSQAKTMIIVHPEQGDIGLLIIQSNRTILPYVFSWCDDDLNAVKMVREKAEKTCVQLKCSLDKSSEPWARG